MQECIGATCEPRMETRGTEGNSSSHEVLPKQSVFCVEGQQGAPHLL